MRKTLILLTCVYCWNIASAQLPNTNIFLFQMEQQSDSSFLFTNPQFLTGFNSSGYNNQPSFISNDEIYFSMGSASEESQTDIISLNLRTQVKTQVTQSEDREYSPTALLEPYYFSCVRQEADGKNTQRLWFFPTDRSSKGKPLLPVQTNVGYHCWLKNEMVALFIVGDPHKLAIANTLDKSVVTLTSNIGRCLQRMPNGNLAFIHKGTETNWTIKELDLNTMRSKTIVATVSQSEDFVILPDNTYLMAKGSKLFKYKKGWDTNWLEVADFGKHNLNNITRMAISKNGKIALVDVK
ncbi:MAG: hypothetical protein AB8F94_20785 [Saprospiraceae bacterium]